MLPQPKLLAFPSIFSCTCGTIRNDLFCTLGAVTFRTQGTPPRYSARWTCWTSSWRERASCAARSTLSRTWHGFRGSGEPSLGPFVVVAWLRGRSCVTRYAEVANQIR